MIDDAHELGDVRTLKTDVCVIGAGAAGITVALGLESLGLDVLLLESGGLKAEPGTQRLYEGSVADEHLHSPPHRFRQRRFGGSTTIWGGRCVPFDPIDFEAREYIPHSGWPFGIGALLPFYPRANDLCDAGSFEYRAAEALPGSPRPMIEGFQSTHFTSDTLERFSLPTDFGARHANHLRAARNMRVLLHANVTELRLFPGGHAVESLTVRTMRGRALTVWASRFVLAVGGLETPRLLLANRSVLPEGIGNGHDVVGRYYMCHIAGALGRFTFCRAGKGVWHGYDRTPEGIYCRRRLALTAEAQRRLRIGNFIARLHHPRITDPSHRMAVLSALHLAKRLISYEYGTRLHSEDHKHLRSWFQHIQNVARAPHEVVDFAIHIMRDRFLAKRKFPSIIVRSKGGIYSLDFHAEQLPNASSRVTLTDERDALGVPRLLIDWRYTPGDIRTVQTAVKLLAEDIRSSGVGVFECDPESIEVEILRYGAYGGHHLGTARMGADPNGSVVDPDCCVHGVKNLYIAGGAVFPTSSQANPTLTIVALALRLAAHLGALATGSRAATVTSEDDPSRRSPISSPNSSPA